MAIFDNTEIAFKSRSTSELKKAVLLFMFMSHPFLVKLSGVLAGMALRLNFPLGWLVRPTIFSHFCGGETLEESQSVVQHLAGFNVKSVLDFAAENQSTDKSIELVMRETLRTIDQASKNPDIPFAVFKPSAFASKELLSASGSYAHSGSGESRELEKFRSNIRVLCQAAFDKGIPVMIDAEESHYQPLVDKLATEMMELFNKEKPVVFNTLQMYRHDRLQFLNECIAEATEKNYYPGIKLVRGAYLEQERDRAAKMGYPSPVYPDKESTDHAFDRAVAICIQNLDRVSVFVGTHNENSILLLIDLLNKHKIDKNDHRVYISQLYGMSDHISFNMAEASYNVAKYLPYGPVKYLLPYLIRRAEENRSVGGQAGRELLLLKTEIGRRRETK